LSFVSSRGELAVLAWPGGDARVTSRKDIFQIARGPGGWVAAPTADSGVLVYDPADDRPVFAFPTTDGDAWGLAFGADGRRLAVCRSDGTLAVCRQFNRELSPAGRPAADFRAATKYREAVAELRKALPIRAAWRRKRPAAPNRPSGWPWSTATSGCSGPRR